MRGAWPGRIPKYPSFPGICISSATSRTTSFSGVTISNWKVFAIGRWASAVGLLVCASWSTSNHERPRLGSCGSGFQLLGCLQHLVNRALHVKGLLGNFIVLAFHNSAEAFHRIRDLHVSAGRSGKLLGHVERLGQESLNLSGTRHRQFLLLTEFVDTKNGDDVLQVLVSLQ